MKISRLLASMLALTPLTAAAIDGEWNGVEYSVKSTVIAGVAVRTEDRDLNRVAKLSIPGQKNLCDADDCMSTNGNPAPNQRLVNAKGAFSGVNADDGNWNYNKGDITDSLIRYSPEIRLKRGDIKVEFSGLFYYDPVNANFTEYHSDDKYQPTHTQRADNVVKAYAEGAELRTAFIQANQEVFGQNVSLKVGRQVLPWGESLLVLFNNLNQLNPVDANASVRPGFQLSDLSVPVNMAVLSFPIVDSLSIELVKPLEWRPVRVAPHGSFASTSDPIGNNYVMYGLGNQHEDPNGLSQPAGTTSLLTKTTYRTSILPESTGYASDSGQFGARLTYIADWLNEGTEFGLYYLRYNSQFPYLSGYAANSTCIKPTTTNIVGVIADCNGLSMTPGSKEALPLNTSKVFFDYPDGIDMFGVSFNSNILGVAMSGEYAYRPNMPLQIHTTDVVYALLQPALPAQDVTVTPGTPLMPATVVPSRSSGVPSYLAQYLGGNIQPNQLIRGYERFQVHNFSLSALKLFPHNPLFADDMTTILEFGATYVANMTDFHVLPLNGSGDNTHPSAGADGTGTASGTPDTRRQTPTTQTWNIPTKLSYGYRSVLKLAYNNLIPHAVVEPIFIFFHDLKGITPSPQTNFIEGRRSLSSTVVVRLENQLQLGLTYEAKFGSNARENQEGDRDRALVFGSYSF